MTDRPPSAPHRIGDLALALFSGALLTGMVFLNGTMGQATTPVFSSVAAHVTGTLAAIMALLAMRRRRGPQAEAGGVPGQGAAVARAPFWAYLAGLSGAVTVILTSSTVNSPLALSGTLALGLAGQAGFAVLSDRFGLFGMPRRKAGMAELLALLLILAGSALIIFAPDFG